VETQLETAGRAFGRGIAAIILTSGGFVWFGWGFSALPAPSQGVLVSYLSVAAVLMAFAVRAMRRSRKMMKVEGVSRSDFWKKRRKAFSVVVVLEVVGCVVVLALVGVFRRPDWAAARVSFIVGLHFLPLARIFESAAYYWVGGLMVAWDIVTVTALKSRNPTASAAIASGVILWVAAIHTLTR
jgi:uncharacterized membrane protein